MAPKAAPKAVKAPAKGSASAGKASKASKTPATTRKNADTKPEPKSTTKKTAEKATKAPAASKKPAVKPNTKAKAVEKMTTTGKKSQEKGTKASATTQKNGITKPTLKSRATAKMSAEKATKALTASKKPTQNPTTKANIPATTSKKRRHNDDDDSEDKEAPPPPPPAKKARITKQPAAKPKINKAPTQILDVFVAGEGSAGELGLGSAKGVIDVKRPRLNPLLSKKEVGVVQVACGGMHMAALTHDNKILTWGVNDVGALGRETTWAGGLKSIDDDDKSVDSDDEDSGLNPLESTPTAIPASSFPDGTTFVKVSAGDSHTLALTDEGLVYGWGQFRKTDGPLGFLPGSDSLKEMTPVLLPGLTKITNITSGANHAMAMDSKGAVYIWGGGEQNQLGYHVVQRTGSESKKTCLKPQPLRTRIKKFLAIYTGLDHSFAIDQKHQVWSWGLNSFGACGIEEGAGDDNSAVHTPSLIKALNLENDTVTHIAGGQHHSIAITAKGKALAWGKVDGAEVGLDMDSVPRTSTIQDEKGDSRIVIVPTEVPDIDGKATYASAGPNHTILITNKGQAYGWGFNGTYQLGLGPNTDVDNATWELPEHIDNTAVRGRTLNGSGCGGQFSMWTAAMRKESSN